MSSKPEETKATMDSTAQTESPQAPDASTPVPAPTMQEALRTMSSSLELTNPTLFKALDEVQAEALVFNRDIGNTDEGGNPVIKDLILVKFFCVFQIAYSAARESLREEVRKDLKSYGVDLKNFDNRVKEDIESMGPVYEAIRREITPMDILTSEFEKTDIQDRRSARLYGSDGSRIADADSNPDEGALEADADEVVRMFQGGQGYDGEGGTNDKGRPVDANDG